MNTFYFCAAAGFVAMGIFRYVVQPGWSLKAFFSTEPRVLLKCLLFTAVSVYFAHDIAALIPKQLFGVTFDAEHTLDRAPKFSGFVLAFLMASPDAGTFLLNIIELIPIIGPIIVKRFRKS